MKISDITHRSQAQHIAEGREKLDEFAITSTALAAIGLVGAGMTAWDTYKNYQAYDRGDITGHELAIRVGADVALGLTTGGGFAIGKAVAKAGFKGAKSLMGFGDDAKKAVDTAKKAVDNAKTIKARADKLPSKLNPLNKTGVDLKGAGKTAKVKRYANKKVKDAKADLKQAKKKVGGPTKKGFAKDFVKGTGIGLAVPDSLDPLRDRVYTAGGGSVPGGAPDSGSGMGGNTGGGQTDAERAAERASRYKSDFITPELVGQKAYDKYTPKKGK